ncbi:MAG TPA: copper ion binding protein [Euzebyales bacterium]|nr:copper ion binding protein [Euzebyales bacterium]
MMTNTPRTSVGTTTFQVAGMTCDHCVHAVTTEVGKLAGVQSVNVDLPTGAVEVTTEQPVDRADVAAAVDEAGYTLVA